MVESLYTPGGRPAVTLAETLPSASAASSMPLKNANLVGSVGVVDESDPTSSTTRWV